ncbi:MAG: anthranilate phosphoribosyltransferase [Proteobacteria bacterium]|nr:anthranilate phosphoribosyltransferase [Pseudomonadota bacterium]
MTDILRRMLEQILDGQHLSEAQAGDLLRALTSPDVPAPLAGALLAGLRAKGVVAEEVRGFALAMRQLGRRPDFPPGLPAIDIVGTGGDASGSLNLSTGSALLTAAAGLPVIKHGNRSISSRSGSADLIERLGVPMPMDERLARQCLDSCGFTFLFAPYYHPAMKTLAPVRAALGIRTVFNLLGPLANPGAPRYYLIGAFSDPAAKLMAEALAGMEVERAWVLHGAQGWDEATPIGPFRLFDVRPGQVEERILDPQDLGIARAGASALAGGDAAANLAALEAVFEGRDTGAHLDALVLQSGLALHIGVMCASIEAGISRARETIRSGQARRWLHRLRSQPWNGPA